MSTRLVTEADIRMPEFKYAKLEDLEFRHDGKIVRKDRWETAIFAIRALLGDPRNGFEIEEVVAAVKALVNSIPKPVDVEAPEQTVRE